MHNRGTSSLGKLCSSDNIRGRGEEDTFWWAIIWGNVLAADTHTLMLSLPSTPLCRSCFCATGWFLTVIGLVCPVCRGPLEAPEERSWQPCFGEKLLAGIKSSKCEVSWKAETVIPPVETLLPPPAENDGMNNLCHCGSAQNNVCAMSKMLIICTSTSTDRQTKKFLKNMFQTRTFLNMENLTHRIHPLNLWLIQVCTAQFKVITHYEFDSIVRIIWNWIKITVK